MVIRVLGNTRRSPNLTLRVRRKQSSSIILNLTINTINSCQELEWWVCWIWMWYTNLNCSTWIIKLWLFFTHYKFITSASNIICQALHYSNWNWQGGHRKLILWGSWTNILAKRLASPSTLGIMAKLQHWLLQSPVNSSFSSTRGVNIPPSTLCS
jgi:hypothetical protein